MTTHDGEPLTPEDIAERCTNATWVGWQMVAGQSSLPPVPPSDAVRADSDVLREATEAYMQVLLDVCPRGPKLDMALTHAENALMCGVASVTEKPKPV